MSCYVDLLSNEQIQGIIPLGTSMDKECQRTIDLGCWDGYKDVSNAVEAFKSEAGAAAESDFEAPGWFCDFLIEVGFGKDVDDKVRAFWHEEIKNNYRGQDGKDRIWMASVNLRDRDGLHARVSDVTCPVRWIHGTKDAVYSVANAKEEIPLFTGSKDAQLQVIEGGQHFLSFSHPNEIAEALLAFVKN